MRCSQASDGVGEPLPGTATICTFWLVVEQPGAYAGREAALSSGMDPRTGQVLLDAVAARGGKLLLARPPGRHPRADLARRRVWLARGDGAVWAATVADPLECLLWLDHPGPPSTSQLVEEPTLFVCTHGRRDMCCARAGRDLLAGPHEAIGTVWESSHQGGHRLAPVVLELTTGYQHGRVSPADLEAIAAKAAQRRIHLPTARGRCSLPAAAQAVDLAVRARTGLDAVDAVVDVTACSASVPGQTPGEWTAAARERPLAARPESCGADPTSATAWDIHLAPVR